MSFIDSYMYSRNDSELNVGELVIGSFFVEWLGLEVLWHLGISLAELILLLFVGLIVVADF